MSGGFDPDDTTRMLADSARSYVERGYGEAVRARSLAHAHGCEPARWQEFAELGWLGLLIPESAGGLSASLADLCAVTEALGPALVVEPFVACSVLGSAALLALASSPARDAWLADLATGARRIAVAAWEPGAGFDHRLVGMRARHTETGLRLEGSKSLVLGGAGADAFVVLARMPGADQVGAFLVPANAPGLEQVPLTLYDGQRAVHLRLDAVAAHEPLSHGAADAMLERLGWALDVAAIAHAAQTVGAMQRAFDITLEYLRTRQQFGKPIATNQVVQHRMVDLMVEIEEARSLTRHTAQRMAWPVADEAAGHARAVAATRACVISAARHVWEESVQLHGAIGMTDEYIVGQYVKQLAAACTLYGGLEQQYERLAAQVLGE